MQNIWTYLLGLFIELRQAWATAISIRTPQFPEGRPIHVLLSVVSCDRPAAVLLAGGPNQANAESFCLSCEAKKSELRTRGE